MNSKLTEWLVIGLFCLGIGFVTALSTPKYDDAPSTIIGAGFRHLAVEELWSEQFYEVSQRIQRICVQTDLDLDLKEIDSQIGDAHAEVYTQCRLIFWDGDCDLGSPCPSEVRTPNGDWAQLIEISDFSCPTPSFCRLTWETNVARWTYSLARSAGNWRVIEESPRFIF